MYQNRYVLLGLSCLSSMKRTIILFLLGLSCLFLGVYVHSGFEAAISFTLAMLGLIILALAAVMYIKNAF